MIKSSIEFNISAEELAGFGSEMHSLMEELFPLCRSITGDGVRETLDIISKHIKIEKREVPTGTKVFDWEVPKEWNINDAYVIDPDGNKIIDFKKSNLHVVNYSIPINAEMSLKELSSHLHSLPDQPDLIPYLTSYYNECWGFCLSHNQLVGLKEGKYKVYIDSSLNKGHLTLAEYYLKGEISDEVVVSCYTCHPSLCNDNLTGVVIATYLAKHLSQMSLKYSYKFLFIPETIGAITWLCLNENNLSNIKHGLIATCVGGPGLYTYQKTRQGNAEIDRIILNVLKHSCSDYKVVDFDPSGSDERQFSSPGFDLPFGLLMKSPFFNYPEYHTSADDLEFVQYQHLAESFSKYIKIIYILENNKTYLNLNPKCEPQLGKRHLYRAIGSQKKGYENQIAMLWILNLSDGEHTLLDISDRSGLEFSFIKDTADLLLSHGLLKEVNERE